MPPTGKNEVIQARRLTKDYGNGRGVFDLDLSIREGEVFGFIGPNGAGKSTTIRTLLDLIRPTRGDVHLFGQRPNPEVRQRIGYLPGELALPEGWPAKVFLRDLADIRGDVDERYLGSLVARLGAQLDEPVRRLSKGNKQKIGLVQAFMHRPDLLILDEPTDGLDPLLRQEVHALIREARAEGRTVFLSSHVIHEVEQVCDRIGLIKDGRLVLVEDVRALRAQLKQEVYIHLGRPIDLARLRAVKGVSDVQQKGPRIRFHWQGAMQPLIRMLASMPARHIRIQPQELEDAILYLYR